MVNIPLLVNNTCVSMCVLAAVPGYCGFIRVNAKSWILHQLCSHFAGGTTAARSRVLISHLEAQLSDRSVLCPDWDLSSLTVGQVFVLIVCVSSAGGFSCLWVVLCGLRGSPHTVCVIEQTQGGRYTITKWTQSSSWVPCTRFTLPITSKL